MATVRNTAPVPTLTAKRKRVGRPPKPARERRAYLVQVAFTEKEYRALLAYQVARTQPTEAAAVRAAVLDCLKSENLTPAD